MAKKAIFANINTAVLNNAPYVFMTPDLRNVWTISVPVDRKDGAVWQLQELVNEKILAYNEAEKKRVNKIRKDAASVIMTDKEAEGIRASIANDCVNFDEKMKAWLSRIGVDITPAVKNSLLGIALASDSCILSIPGMEKAVEKHEESKAKVAAGKSKKASTAPDGWKTKDAVRMKLVKGFILWAVNGRKALIASKGEDGLYSFTVRGSQESKEQESKEQESKEQESK